MYNILYILIMKFGFHLLAWRHAKNLTQEKLAQKVGCPRPYLSRLERDEVDPSLSLVRRMAVALDISVGDLVENRPVPPLFSREKLDHLAREALRPHVRSLQNNPMVRSLSRALQKRRAALGCYQPRGQAQEKRSAINYRGINVFRRVRAELGERQYQALLKRIDKHAAMFIPHHED